MKKTLSTIVAILIITIMMAMSVSAYTDAYPYSPEYGFDAVTDGEILIGELFGTDPWDNSENTYDKAWDGDIETFYDPSAAGDVCYTGVKLSEEYILTEIRIHPRTTFLDRYLGATIQGSNDGENWTNIYVSEAAAEAVDYVVIKAADFIAGSNTGYSYYRYINTGLNAEGNPVHGDVGEVELYGNTIPEPEPIIEVAAPTEEAAAPAEAAPAPVAAVTTAPQTNDNFIISVSLMSIALIAAFIVMKKKVTR